MGQLALTIPSLRRRSCYHACMFGAFSLFWTAVPLLLTGPAFRLSQGGLAGFAFAGVAGAIAAPIAGRIADRGWIRSATASAMLAVAAAFMMTRIIPEGSTEALGALVAAAVLLDFGVSAHMIISQRVIFALGAEYRSRLNGIYIATIFCGGAVGSAVAGWAYAQGGWPLTACIGSLFPLVAFVYFTTELTARDMDGAEAHPRDRDVIRENTPGT